MLSSLSVSSFLLIFVMLEILGILGFLRLPHNLINNCSPFFSTDDLIFIGIEFFKYVINLCFTDVSTDLVKCPFDSITSYYVRAINTKHLKHGFTSFFRNIIQFNVNRSC